MKEQLVNKATAFIAKEKGFDWECRHYCDQLSIVISIPQSRMQDQNRMTDYVYVPTQSLLQRWLRDKYHIHIHVADLGLEMWSNMIIKLDIDGTQGIGGDLGKKNYKTYELALEEGLKQALNLIP